jgi:2-phosphosulfolactate phosphatase
MCCAWIAELLVAAGYEPQDAQTAGIISRWHGAAVEEILDGASAEYLRRSGQVADLEFVLSHVDDLSAVYRFTDGEVVQEPHAGPVA